MIKKNAIINAEKFKGYKNEIKEKISVKYENIDYKNLVNSASEE
jgi:hypothetical protein